MIQNSLKPLRPMILVFIFLTAIFITSKSWLAKKGVDQDVLIFGNLILFLVMLSSFLLTQRSLKAANPNVFVRAIYLSFIIKFFILAIGAFVYIMSVKEKVNKPALLACMGLYIVYTYFEVSSLMKLLKQRKNA